MIDNISNTINMISLGFLHSNKKIKARSANSAVIEFFYRHNFIQKTYFINNFTCFELNLHKNVKIKNYYRKHSKIRFTALQLILKKTHMFSTIYILSNNRGIVTQHEAIKFNCGGELVAKIYIK